MESAAEGSLLAEKVSQYTSAHLGLAWFAWPLVLAWLAKVSEELSACMCNRVQTGRVSVLAAGVLAPALHGIREA